MIDPIGQIVGDTPEPTLISYNVAVELAISWAIARPGVLPFYSALYRGATMNSHGSGRPYAECRDFLDSLPPKDEAGQILRSYANLIDSAHEMTDCGTSSFEGAGPPGWIEEKMGMGLLYAQHVCREAGLAQDVEDVVCVMFTSIIQERAEAIAALGGVQPAAPGMLN